MKHRELAIHLTPESLFAERRKKRAPIDNRSLYQIEHSQLILSTSRPAVCTIKIAHLVDGSGYGKGNPATRSGTGNAAWADADGSALVTPSAIAVPPDLNIDLGHL